MELRPGYKRTEVGVIPEEWEVTTVGDIASFSGGSQPPRSTFKFSPAIGYIRLIQIRDYKSDDFATYIPEQLASKRCSIKDIMIGRYGPPIFQILRGIEGAYNVALIKATPTSKVEHEYFYFLLKQDRLLHVIESLSKRSSGQTGIEMPALKGFSVALPSPSEQRAIATALSDVDALLAQLDRLIAKKRDIKQAAMQQLLTGKMRLPGFDGEWRKVSFGDIARPRGSRIDPRRQGAQGFCIELEHLESGTGRLSGSTAAGEGASLKTVFQAGDVLFGKLRAYLRKFWLADRPGVCSTEIWALEPSPNVTTSGYLAQVVMGAPFIEAASNAHGTHMPRSDWHVVKNLETLLPPIEEQTAIATLLSDLDAELAALEARRDKTRALKQGMMQELLTGKTRLI